MNIIDNIKESIKIARHRNDNDERISLWFKNLDYHKRVELYNKNHKKKLKE